MGQMSNPSNTPASLDGWGRVARISTSDQTVIGACIFLTEGDLRSLGIEIGGQEAIRYGITERHGEPELCLRAADTGKLDSASITD